MNLFRTILLLIRTRFPLIRTLHQSIAIGVAAAGMALSAQSVPMDYSYAGYGGGRPMPAVAAVLLVRPSGQDDTALIQGALDKVASLPVGADGFRGAVQLARGRYHLRGRLQMRVSGVVLRGAGASETTLVAEGTSRRTLLEIGATEGPALGAARAVDRDAAVGSRELHLDSIAGLSVGAHVVVRRPSNEAWISDLDMRGLSGIFADIRLDWKPGSHDLVWNRTVKAVHAQAGTVELDAPITTALEQRYGGGTLAPVTEATAPERIGVEDLTMESSFDARRPKDEDHAWIAILFDHVQDGWVRAVTARHFAGSAVRVNWQGRRITIADCRSEAPVSEEGGYRRQSFRIDGQQVLVVNCYSEAGMNDFASGLLAGGPNVFLNCDAVGSLGASGAFEGWSSGVLYEQVHVRDAKLQLLLDFDRAQGAGWTAANSLIWNSTARSIDVLGPPGAGNFAVRSAEPLYATQLMARTGQQLEELLRGTADAEPVYKPDQNIDGVQTHPSDKDKNVARVGHPDKNVARDGHPDKNVARIWRPDKDVAVARMEHPIGLAIPVFQLPEKKIEASSPVAIHPVRIVNGRFVVDGQIDWGESQTEAWWRGDTSPYTALDSTGGSVTRFMPGVTAPGETEDLRALVERLKKRGAVSIQVNPGLWYDHRRDAHSMERRADGNVWAPFFEMPWARSGEGTAWDGLSRFDLSRYNPWYFERHKEFAQLAAEAGLLVFYDLYNTHNVLEIGAHWIDSPWRPANNINETGLADPPSLRPNGRNDLGNAYFSTTNVALRALHRAYILHTLNELGDAPNVIFGVAYQYAGPLGFEEFFQDTVAEWEQKHGKHVRIALTTSKQTTEAILADPVRARQIAVVDMRYWEYRPDGSLFAPEAGIDRAFREQITAAFPGYTDTPPDTTPEQVYRQIREYRDRYPEIALMPMENGAGSLPLLMAGAAAPSALQSHSVPQAACAPLSADKKPCLSPDQIASRFVQIYLAKDLMKMSPRDGLVAAPERTWVLAGGATEPVVIYSLAGRDVSLIKNLPAERYTALWFNPRNGEAQEAATVSGAAQTTVSKPDQQAWLLLLRPVEPASR